MPGRRTLAHEREMDRLLTGVDLFTPIQDVLILGKNGYVYNLQNRQNLKSDYDFTAQDWFVQASTVEDGVTIKLLPLHDQRYYGERQEPTASYEQTLSLAMAVHNANRQTVGAIVCCFDLSSLNALFGDANNDQSARLVLLDVSAVLRADEGRRRSGAAAAAGRGSHALRRGLPARKGRRARGGNLHGGHRPLRPGGPDLSADRRALAGGLGGVHRPPGRELEAGGHPGGRQLSACGASGDDGGGGRGP